MRLAYPELYDLDMGSDFGLDETAYAGVIANIAEGDVVELGVGTGRLAQTINKARVRVIGVDDDPEMLDRARSVRRSRLLTLVHADVRTWKPESSVTVVVMAMNFIYYFDDDEKVSLLDHVYSYLGPGGHVMMDVVTPDLSKWDGRLSLEWVRQAASLDTLVTKSLSIRHNPSNGVAVMHQIYEWTERRQATHRLVHEDVFHVTPVTDLQRMLTTTGFKSSTVSTLPSGHALLIAKK